MTTALKTRGGERPSQILIIEDSLTDSALIEAILRGAGFLARTGIDGEECFEILRVFHPDLILLDIVLPGIDGFEICARLKERVEYHDVPVIFLSSRNAKEDIVRGFESGGSDYIMKPVDARELLARIRNHIALKKSRDVIEAYIEKLNYEYIEREKLDFLKDRFLAMISHDLKNPIVDLQRTLEDVLASCGHGENDPMRTTLMGMKRTLEYTRLLLNDLLDIATIESGKPELSVSEVDYRTFLEGVLVQKRPRAADRDIDINLSITGDIPPVYLDAKKITQVINNIVENALRYSPPGVPIDVLVDVIGRSVRTRIVDHGSGIPEEMQKYIFDRYKRVRGKNATYGEEGSGLGLAIVKNIVEAHRGTVGVSSEPGEGTCFYFNLPLYFDL